MSLARVRTCWASCLTLLSLSLVLFWLLFHSGGLFPSHRLIAIGWIASTSLVLQTLTPEQRRPLFSRTVRISFAALCTCVCFQLVPLPLAVVGWLSPGRAELTQTVHAYLGGRTLAPLSVFPIKSLLEGATAAAAVLVLLCIRRLACIFAGRRWFALIPLLLAGVWETWLALMQAADVSGPATSTGTFLNRNHLAGFLEMTFPFCLMGAWACLRNVRVPIPLRACLTLILILSAILMVDAILHTYSRMGWLVTLVNLFLLVSVTYGTQARQVRPKLWIIAAGLIALVLAATVLAPVRLLNRLGNGDAIDRDSTQLRLGFWKDSLPLIREYALTGSGLGTFSDVYPRYQTTGLAFRIEYAHNDFIQAAVEMGLPAFFAALVLVSGLAAQVSRSLGKIKNIQVSWYSIAGIASTCGLLLHSFVDFNLHIPANAITIAWIVGLVMSIDSDDKHDSFRVGAS